MTNTQTPATIHAYTGTIAIIDGEHGTVTQTHYEGFGNAQRLAGLFVRLDLRPAMLYVSVGEKVADTVGVYEVRESREITRDEFDTITGLATIRREMGWKL